MNLILMSLYAIGVIGVIISTVMIFMSIGKNSLDKNKTSFMITGCIFILSLLLIGIGAFFTLQSTNSNKTNSTTSNSNSNAETSSTNSDNTQAKAASIDNLKFTYNFDNNTNESEKSISAIIDNSTNSIFNGKIDLKFTDSSNNIISTIELPIHNLLSESTLPLNILVGNSVTNVNYSFSGSFDSNEKKNSPYTIKKELIGNGSYLFDVSVEDTSYSNLQKISDEFKKEYGSSVCNSFLIYFYLPDKSDKFNLNDAIADFSCDYLDNTEKLTTYN